MDVAATAIGFEHVSYALPDGRLLVRDVSLQVEPGTTTAVLGRSGSGKTTLLRMVNGLVRATAGRVLVGGRDVATEDVVALRRGIGYVIQETGLFPHMTVERNAGMALELAGTRSGDTGRSRSLQDDNKGTGNGRSRSPSGMTNKNTNGGREARVSEVLQLVGMDAAEFRGRYPWQLSGGQRQRVGLARALAADPQVLLMDEPLGALDPMTRAEMQTMLRGLLERLGKTVLMVTHDLDEALYLAGRVVFMEAGQVVANLSSEEVLGSEHARVREYVKAVRRGSGSG
jgi:osmoprotectant transport system ATP-binding protein